MCVNCACHIVSAQPVLTVIMVSSNNVIIVCSKLPEPAGDITRTGVSSVRF